MYGIVYKATNEINGKSYVGQTKNLEQRKQQHLKTGTYFHNALKKYGFDNFKWEVIENCNSKNELNEMEFHYIKQYNTFVPCGYNLTSGGEGILEYKHTNEIKEKISKNSSKYWLGKKLSENHKRKMSKSHRGKKLSTQHKQKISKSNVKYWLGKKKSRETKEKISSTLSKKWIIYSPTNEIFIIKNLYDFCNKNGLNSGHMYSVAYGNKKQYKGWKCSKGENNEINNRKFI